MYRRFFNFGLSAALAYSLTIPSYRKSYQCFWPWDEEVEEIQIQRNILKHRLNILEYPSNTPSQDAVQWAQLQGISGYAIAVFDGHGGNQVSEYLKTTLIELIDNKLKQNQSLKQTDAYKMITKSMSQAFKQAQSYILQQSQKPQGMFKSKQGSTGLVAIVSDNNIYIANLGDSKAAILSVSKQDPNAGQVYITSLNKRMNINEPQYGRYLSKIKSTFDEKKILTTVKNKLFLKSPEGKIQLTGSFGDLFMKKFQPALKNKSSQFSSKSLITSKPLISRTQIKEQDNYLILASDGLWNQIKDQQLFDHFKGQKNEYVLQQILQKVVKNIAVDLKQQPQFVRDLPSEMKPDIFDDISILLVDLKNQYEFKDEDQ